MISVIIPTYKGSRFLSRAIDSVLLQDKVDFEIIVVDDNDPKSTERKKTEHVMEKYKTFKNVRYIKHVQNYNGSVARNTGLKAANGQYINFLDDDDFYLPGRLSVCLKAINNVEIVYTDTLMVGTNVNYISAQKSGNLFVDLLTNDMLIGTGSNLFFKRKIIDRFGGFREDLVRHQDYEFLLRMFSHNVKAKAINSCFVVKATNGTNNQVNYLVLKKVKEELNKEFENDIDKLPNSTINKIAAYHHRQLLWTAMNDGNEDGILEEENKLKQLGFLDAKYYLKKKFRNKYLFNILRKIVEYRKIKRLEKDHKDAFVYTERYMQKYL